MKTYEIKDFIFNHPELGELKKQGIIYYENDKDIGTPEYYNGDPETIRIGYKLREN